MSAQLIGGPIGNWLAIIGVISLLYWAWRITMALQNRGGSGVQVSPVALPAADAAPQAMDHDDDLVVIAAAIFAMTNARRIVQILPASSNRSWADAGRWAQQTSHAPR